MKRVPPIAQLVEQPALNRWVLGSSPSGRTRRGGEIGRRTGFRNQRGNPWRFESSPRHIYNIRVFYLRELRYCFFYGILINSCSHSFSKMEREK